MSNEAFVKWGHGGDFRIHGSTCRLIFDAGFAAGKAAERDRILSEEMGVYNEGRKDEREACAEIADKIVCGGPHFRSEIVLADKIAAAIRARE